MNPNLPLTAVKLVSTTSGSQSIAISSATYDASTKTYNMVLSTPLAYSTKYNIVIDPTEIKDANGNSMAATTPVTYSFTTENNPVVPPVTLPTIVSVTPNDGATGIDIDPTKIKLALSFNEGMNSMLHSFIKKTRKTPKKDLDIAKKRMKEIKNES